MGNTMYENTKSSQIMNEAATIIQNKQSIKPPLMHDIIQSKVKYELHKIMNKITMLQKKYEQNRSKLKQLKMKK